MVTLDSFLGRLFLMGVVNCVRHEQASLKHEKANRDEAETENAAWAVVMVVVKWSACLPSATIVKLRILLKSTLCVKIA